MFEFDLNHDGKIDAMDYALYDEINRDDSNHEVHRHKSSDIWNCIWGIAALLYLSAFLNGSIGFGPIRFILALISMVIVLIWLGGGLS